MSPETTSFRPRDAEGARPAAAGAAPEFRPLERESAADRAERARSAGYAAGWAAGARAAAESAMHQERRVALEAEQAKAARDLAVRRVVSLLEDAAERAEERRAPVLDAAAELITTTAVRLAEAVLQRELADGGSVRSVLERAITAQADVAVHTVRVSPQDLAGVRAELALSDAALPSSVQLVADPSLSVGDVVCEHADGWLDGRIRAGLERALAVLEEDL